MDSISALTLVRKMMIQFADRTGVSSPRKAPQRYLWTDAFAVCNFLELYSRTGEAKYLQLALSLVDQVHATLGRHRSDDARTGWISGLAEEEGKKHPTRGGLRIGKTLGERKLDEPLDEQLEWDRDGQYFHYLTKWMHALSQAGRITQEPKFNRWAVEMARAVHARFVYEAGSGRQRMYWKMSIDLSYPLVPSMGHHDPLDGLITYRQLQSTVQKDLETHPELDLTGGISDMTAICAGKSWVTDDPLGIGGLLADAGRLFQLIARRYCDDYELLEMMLKSALPGLEAFVQQKSLQLPADYRLPFRECGLSIGLGTVKRILKGMAGNSEQFRQAGSLETLLRNLLEYVPLIETIENFWLDPIHQKTDTWTGHQEINRVMLATSLAPDGFLKLG